MKLYLLSFLILSSWQSIISFYHLEKAWAHDSMKKLPRFHHKSSDFKVEKESLSHGLSISTAPPFNIFKTLLVSTFLFVSFTPSISAIDNTEQTTPLSLKDKEIIRWKKGLFQVNDLLSHWEDKTTYCNYGEFQNELLSKDRKEQLIEKVKESKGLLDYDKTATMKVKCRRDPEMVRAYFGWKPENNPTLYNVELSMLKKEIINSIDDAALLDQYINAVESFTSAKAEVNTLSYEARTDFASQQTFSPEEMKTSVADGQGQKKRDYLAQCKESAVKARDALTKIVEILQE